MMPFQLISKSKASHVHWGLCLGLGLFNVSFFCPVLANAQDPSLSAASSDAKSSSETVEARILLLKYMEKRVLVPLQTDFASKVIVPISKGLDELDPNKSDMDPIELELERNNPVKMVVSAKLLDSAQETSAKMKVGLNFGFSLNKESIESSQDPEIRKLVEAYGSPEELTAAFYSHIQSSFKKDYSVDVPIDDDESPLSQRMAIPLNDFNNKVFGGVGSEFRKKIVENLKSLESAPVALGASPLGSSPLKRKKIAKKKPASHSLETTPPPKPNDPEIDALLRRLEAPTKKNDNEVSLSNVNQELQLRAQAMAAQAQAALANLQMSCLAEYQQKQAEEPFQELTRQIKPISDAIYSKAPACVTMGHLLPVISSGFGDLESEAEAAIFGPDRSFKSLTTSAKIDAKTEELDVEKKCLQKVSSTTATAMEMLKTRLEGLASNVPREQLEKDPKFAKFRELKAKYGELERFSLASRAGQAAIEMAKSALSTRMTSLQTEAQNRFFGRARSYNSLAVPQVGSSSSGVLINTNGFGSSGQIGPPTSRSLDESRPNLRDQRSR